jgi:hypothetical protein
VHVMVGCMTNVRVRVMVGVRVRFVVGVSVHMRAWVMCMGMADVRVRVRDCVMVMVL